MIREPSSFLSPFLFFLSLSLSLNFSRILGEAVVVAEDERGGASIQIVKRKMLSLASGR